MLTHHKEGLLSLNLGLILDNSVDLWVGVQSANNLGSQTSQLRILHLAEDDNWSLFNSKTVCLCQSFKINNKHVYRQSQVQKPIGSVVKWAEYSLTIGTGCWIQVIAWSSLAQPVCEWAFSLLAIWCLRLPSFEFCIQQRKTTCLLSIRKSLACARAAKLITTNMYVSDCLCNSLLRHTTENTWKLFMTSSLWVQPMGWTMALNKVAIILQMFHALTSSWQCISWPVVDKC